MPPKCQLSCAASMGKWVKMMSVPSQQSEHTPYVQYHNKYVLCTLSGVAGIPSHSQRVHKHHNDEWGMGICPHNAPKYELAVPSSLTSGVCWWWQIHHWHGDFKGWKSKDKGRSDWCGNLVRLLNQHIVEWACAFLRGIQVEIRSGRRTIKIWQKFAQIQQSNIHLLVVNGWFALIICT